MVEEKKEEPAKPKEDPSEKDCVICEERKADVALLECGHMSFCAKCAETLVGKECPLCRQVVVRFLKIYQNL